MSRSGTTTLLFEQESFGSFNEQNERIYSEKDSFILMNKFEQESHERAVQSKATI